MRAEISKSAGPGVGVKALQQRYTCEVRDLDEWTTKEEILEAVITCSGAEKESVRVFSLRKRFGGTQSALLSAEAETVTMLTTSGRLRVGMVSCRVRQVEDRIRCFQCLTFGHLARDCTGPDRSECCSRCGGKYHKAAGCDAPVETAREFARTIEASNTREPRRHPTGEDNRSAGKGQSTAPGPSQGQACDGQSTSAE